MILYERFNNIILKIKMFNKKNNTFHKSFKIGILLKGIDGVLEIIGGILLAFLNPNRLNRIIVILTQHELSEDPKDAIANFAMSMASNFSINNQHFGIYYLMSHGIIKLILVIMLWKRKIWAYPLTVGSLLLFIFYQVYRCIVSYSAGLIVLTVFDIIMIILTLIEYSNVRNNTR